MKQITYLTNSKFDTIHSLRSHKQLQ